MGGSSQTQRSNQRTTRNPYAPSIAGARTTGGMLDSWLNSADATATWQGPRVAGMSDYTTRGLNQLANSGQQSRGYFDSVLSGNFMDQGNPYQSQLDDSIIASMMPTLNSQFSGAGLTGSTMHQGTVTRELGRALAAPRYQNYQMERGYQNQAAGALAGLDQQLAGNLVNAGMIDTAQRQAEIDAQRQAFEEQRLAPINAVNMAMPSLQALGGMGGTSTSRGRTTTTSNPSLGQQIAGGAMMGLSMMNPAMGAMAGLSGGLSALTNGLGQQQQPQYPYNPFGGMIY